MSIEAMKDARSVILSINSGRNNAIAMNGETVFWQREEWVRWALDEVLPVLEQAIAEAEQKNSFSRFTAKMKAANEPCSEVLALGQMMREWLESQIADAGTSVDTGKGFSEYDLWVQCEGKEIYINIKEKRPTK